MKDFAFIDVCNAKIAVIGLGYVGLPLAVEFGKKYKTVGFDINVLRVNELKNGEDHTNEVSLDEMKLSSKLSFTNDFNDLKECNVYIVTVPTPIDSHRQPDLSPLVNASKTIGKVISQGDIIIYESTVYPGATEEVCVPVLEKYSGMIFNKDFFVGYSPERINPGDKSRPVTSIVKVTSGSTAEAANFVDDLYRTIIKAGTYKASSIKVAEASKIIENTQRDVNIALINELAMICNKVGIDTYDVIDAASTKWNFIKLQPGLVGGHCIGVDPYYLVHKSMALGYIPDIIRKAREVNDSMARFIASKVIREMINKDTLKKGAKVLILGFTFKENCPDIRNTKIIDLYNELYEYGLEIDIYDPWALDEEVYEEYGIQLKLTLQGKYDAAIFAVAHDEFKAYEEIISIIGKKSTVYLDMKNILDKSIENRVVF